MTYTELFKYRKVETLMSVESTERDGQDGGGIYQTPKSSSIIAKLYVIVHKIFKQLQVDYEKENHVIEKIFLDAGCGAHLPGLMFAIGGYKSIGLEIDRMRCALAAIILQDVLARATQRLDLALFNTDIKQEGNWSGVLVFYFWDRVRVILFPPSVSMIFTSIDQHTIPSISRCVMRMLLKDFTRTSTTTWIMM